MEREISFDEHNGYFVINVTGHPLFPNRKHVNYHRFLMSEYLGRRLLSKEIVHHKDGNKLNNDISNLELHTRGSHAATHSKGSKRSEETKRLMSEKAKLRNADPEYKKMLSERAKKQHVEGKLGYATVKDKEALREKIAAKIREFYSDKERSAKVRADSSSRMKETQAKLWEDEEYRIKMSPILANNANTRRGTIKPKQVHTVK